MKTKEEIKQWLLENCVDEYGNLILNGLDFSDFEGDVYANRWQVKNTLWQDEHVVDGDLNQDSNWVSGNLYQSANFVAGVIYQRFNVAKTSFVDDFGTQDVLKQHEENKK